MGKNAGEVAQNAQRLSRGVGRSGVSAGFSVSGGSGGSAGWVGRGAGGRQPKPVQQRREHAPAHRLGQHMGHALQISFFLPLRLFGAGIKDNRAPGRFTAQLLQEPNLPDAGQFNINDAGLGQTVLQQRFRLLQAGASDDAVLLGIDSRADRFREIRMFSQHQ